MLSVEVAKGVTRRGVFADLKYTREATDPQGSGRAESSSRRRSHGNREASSKQMIRQGFGSRRCFDLLKKKPYL
jgi:hypothetical protein